MSPCPLLLLLCSTVLGAAAPPPPVPVYRTFGHWFVACDNTRSCVARGFDDATRAQLEYSRPAGAAPATLAFGAEDPVKAGDMRVDGAPLALPPPAWSVADGAPATRDPAAIDAFVAATRNAQAITLDVAAAKDDTPRTVPLDGMTAALLLVDAVQGRPGTPTALVAPRGDGTPPAAPPVPPKPRWTRPADLPRDEALRLLRQARQLPSAVFTCDSKDPPSVWALDAANALAIRPCYLAAYQGSSVVAVLPRNGGAPKPVKLVLPGVPADSNTDGPDMVDPGFDPATGALSTTAKGRGIGDCGSSEVWVWSEGAFRISSLAYQGACGGSGAGEWPTLFRSR